MLFVVISGTCSIKVTGQDYTYCDMEWDLSLDECEVYADYSDYWSYAAMGAFMYGFYELIDCILEGYAGNEVGAWSSGVEAAVWFTGSGLSAFYAYDQNNAYDECVTAANVTALECYLQVQIGG